MLNIPKTKYGPVFTLLIISVLISFLARLILLIKFNQSFTGSSIAVFSSFFVGFTYDLLIGLLIILPFVLQITFINNFIYTPTGKWISLSVFATVRIILLFTSLVPKDLLHVFFLITIFLLVFNAVSEWFFWNGFSSRYNFIAVDCLIYTPVENRRAFISNYQGLGYLKNDILIVQWPVRKIKTYLPDFITGEAKEITGNTLLTEEAIAYYQTIS